jgi:hypothetical protein
MEAVHISQSHNIPAIIFHRASFPFWALVRFRRSLERFAFFSANGSAY